MSKQSYAAELGEISAAQLEAINRAEIDRHPYRRYFGPCTTLTPKGPCGNMTLDSTHCHCAKCGALV